MERQVLLWLEHNFVASDVQVPSRESRQFLLQKISAKTKIECDDGFKKSAEVCGLVNRE